MFEQAAFPVQNEQGFQQLSQQIEAAFATNRADLFLSSTNSFQQRGAGPIRGAGDEDRTRDQQLGRL